MTGSYIFLLPQSNLRLYNRIAYLVIALNFLFFSYLYFYTGAGKHIFFLFLIALSFCFEWLYKKFINGQYYFLPNYFILLMGWIFISPNYFMILLHLILGIMDVMVKNKILLQVNEAGIKQTQGPFKKMYDWELLSNIILKDGLLTLDFKNNKILQYEIRQKEDEDEFNIFCSRHLFK